MKNRRKQWSMMLLGLTILMTIPLVACEPRWCDEQWTEFMNWEYGHTVTYPLSCSMSYSDSGYLHQLSIFFADGVSEVRVRVYKDMDSDSVESLFDTFKDDILTATQEGEAGLFVKRCDYGILQSWEDEFFREIRYTFTKAQVDIKSDTWEETDMMGETWWCVGSNMGTEYFYSFTYETVVGCEKCIWVCPELSQDCFSGVYDSHEQIFVGISSVSGFGKEQPKGIGKREAKNEVHKDF